MGWFPVVIWRNCLEISQGCVEQKTFCQYFQNIQFLASGRKGCCCSCAAHVWFFCTCLILLHNVLRVNCPSSFNSLNYSSSKSSLYTPAIVLDHPSMKECPVILGTPTLYRAIQVIKQSEISQVAIPLATSLIWLEVCKLG